MIDYRTLVTQQSMHLYSVFAKSFKSVNEHAVAGIKTVGFNPTVFAVMEVFISQGRAANPTNWSKAASAKRKCHLCY